MTLITNKTLDYVLDHLGEKNVYNIDIKRDTLDVCIELLKNNSKNAAERNSSKNDASQNASKNCR